MTFNELQEKYNSHKAVCSVCGKSLETSEEAGPIGQYFVLDKNGNFYCTDCDSEFEDGDERIFDTFEKPVNEYSLDEILNAISGIFDFAYECEIDEKERAYICDVENALYTTLKDAGLIK